MDIDTATVHTVSVVWDTRVAGAFITHTVADIGNPKAAAGAAEIVRARLLPDLHLYHSRSVWQAQRARLPIQAQHEAARGGHRADTSHNPTESAWQVRLPDSHLWGIRSNAANRFDRCTGRSSEVECRSKL